MAKPSREYIFGLNPAFEVLRAGRRKIFGATLAEGAAPHSKINDLARDLEQRSIPVERAGRERILQLAENKEHQGVVLKTSPYPYTPFAEIRGTRILLLDRLEDPNNVGALIRSAEVFGFHDILLSEKGTPEIYPSIVKVSVGATEHVRIAKDHASPDYARQLHDRGFSIVALDAAGTVALETIKPGPGQPLLLVVGGEAAAVDPLILKMADTVARIDQKGAVNSLNAAIAGSIALFLLRAS
jgi:23S rRNA (guanosine2251-2'-O)-methyltransferase